MKINPIIRVDFHFAQANLITVYLHEAFIHSLHNVSIRFLSRSMNIRRGGAYLVGEGIELFV